MPTAINVRVPASTSNLGPGFDCLGFGLKLYNEFLVAPLAGRGESTFAFEGPERGSLGPGDCGLFRQSFQSFYDHIGRKAPRTSVVSRVNIPNARGLGSSSTAIVAALVAANELSGKKLDREVLLNLATNIEGHPDNVTPALFGGLTAAIRDHDGSVIHHRFLPSRKLGFVVLSPAYEVKTKAARGVLPSQIKLTDAVSNSSRMPLLVNALTSGETDHLATLTEDRYHEPYRMSLYPGYAELKAAALKLGAAAVCLSGAGPSMFAICKRADRDKLLNGWAEAMLKMNIPGAIRILDPDTKGARIAA